MKERDNDITEEMLLALIKEMEEGELAQAPSYLKAQVFAKITEAELISKKKLLRQYTIKIATAAAAAVMMIFLMPAEAVSAKEHRIPYHAERMTEERIEKRFMDRMNQTNSRVIEILDGLIDWKDKEENKYESYQQ